MDSNYIELDFCGSDYNSSGCGDDCVGCNVCCAFDGGIDLSGSLLSLTQDENSPQSDNAPLTCLVEASLVDISSPNMVGAVDPDNMDELTSFVDRSVSIIGSEPDESTGSIKFFAYLLAACFLVIVLSIVALLLAYC
ncbi:MULTISPECIES: hypothetical protein [Candidatus Ichthyocystis]|uniref:Putative membrane protein n=1 Tax=Candidatus Ichthyocystis hellenicum TaxID=1561003 RepID=A0A0S4M8L6_9BURK|nr:MULTISPECIES: hypothetical protein [Ichthyocystis]CUT17748.1 putative membrane protein [Candidatus Ichthyocystis hellenicum]